MSCPRVSPIVVVICLLGLWTTSVVAQEPAGMDDQSPRFGGPNAVENQLRNDAEIDRPTIVEHWFDWKAELAEKHGLSFSIDYSAVYLGASESPGDDRASSGMVRFFGSWDLVGRGTKNTGAFVWKVEHRHAYTDVAPSGFGFNLGYVGLFEPPFSDQGLRWTNFFWRQRWKEGKVTVLAGFLDATDYVDVYSLASPWTGFLNFAFSTGSQTIPVPNDAALGVAAGAMLTDNLFLIGGLVDSNADPTEFWQGFDTFFNDNEYFKSVEIGWTASQDRIYLDNVHLTLWHADERVEAATPSGWGANISHETPRWEVAALRARRLVRRRRQPYAEVRERRFRIPEEPGQEPPRIWPQLGRAQREHLGAGSSQPVHGRALLPLAGLQGDCHNTGCGVPHQPGSQPRHRLDLGFRVAGSRGVLTRWPDAGLVTA